MLSQILAGCLSSDQVQDRQSSKPCFPEITSTEPSSRPGMVVASTPGPWLEQEWLDDAERIRGGALSCACCGGSGGSQPSLNPQPDPPPETNPSGTVEISAKASERGRQMSQVGSPPLPLQTERVDPAQSTSPSHSLVPGDPEAGRSRAKSLNPPAPSQPKSRDRHITSPSILQTAQQTSASSGIVSPTYDNRSGRNPVLPPSVSTQASSRRPPGEAAPKAPFARN